MNDIISAMRAWLPVPMYAFVGGPFDGQRRKVELVETGRGMIAPEIWNVAEDLPAPKPSRHPEPVACDAVITVHRYRFVAEDRFHNSGYYEYIDPNPAKAPVSPEPLSP